MPVRIRLQRHGKKGKPFYWLVAADSRAKRDGKYLEKIGNYNPNTNPASVEINVEKAIKWLENGAVPSDTARTLLSYRGVMLKYHLNGGVKKGALSQEEADKKLDLWLSEKDKKINSKIETITKKDSEDKKETLKKEKEVSDKRIEDAAKALLEQEKKSEEAPTTEEAPATEEAPTTEETPATEKAPASEESPEKE